jgi:hypothetical protein
LHEYAANQDAADQPDCITPVRRQLIDARPTIAL